MQSASTTDYKKNTICSKPKVVTLLIKNYLVSFQTKITTKELGAICYMQSLLFGVWFGFFFLVLHCFHKTLMGVLRRVQEGP